MDQNFDGGAGGDGQQNSQQGGGGQGGSGQGGSGQGGSGQGGSGQGGSGQGRQDGGGAQPYYPEKLPDHMRGASDRETLDKVFGAYSGFREEISKRGAVPKTPDEYVFEFSDEMRHAFGDPDADPRVKIFRNVAHKAGLTDKQAAAVLGDYHQELLGQNLVERFDADAEIDQLVENKAGLTPEQKKFEAGQRWKAGTDWVKGLAAQNAITEKGSNLLLAVAETAEGVKVIEAFKNLTREHGLQNGGDGASQGLTKADLDRRVADPRGQPFNAKFDRHFAEETDRLFKSFYSQKR
jgi:hypothetical protein